MNNIYEAHTATYVQQGEVKAGDTVYVENKYGYANKVVKVTVVRTTKTLVEVKYASGYSGKFRWSERGLGEYKTTDKYASASLLTATAGAEMVEKEKAAEQTQNLQAGARKVAEKLEARKQWMTADDIEAAAQELLAIAAQLRTIA